MKISSLMGFVIMSTFACTSLPGKSLEDRKEIIGLEEMSLEYIKSHWGEPDANNPQGEGRTVRYKAVRTEEENPISGQMDVKFCDVRLDLNKELIVGTWEYENCRAQK